MKARNGSFCSNLDFQLRDMNDDMHVKYNKNSIKIFISNIIYYLYIYLYIYVYFCKIINKFIHIYTVKVTLYNVLKLVTFTFNYNIIQRSQESHNVCTLKSFKIRHYCMNQTRFLINWLHVFYGQCSEICGADHRFIPTVIEKISTNLLNFKRWNYIT